MAELTTIGFIGAGTNGNSTRFGADPKLAEPRQSVCPAIRQRLLVRRSLSWEQTFLKTQPT